MGALSGATHYGEDGVKGEGPYCRIWLQIVDESIKEASFESNGCPSMIASASQVSELVAGRTVCTASLIEPSDLLLILGGLPEGKEACASRAVNALRKALSAPIQPRGSEL